MTNVNYAVTFGVVAPGATNVSGTAAIAGTAGVPSGKTTTSFTFATGSAATAVVTALGQVSIMIMGTQA